MVNQHPFAAASANEKPSGLNPAYATARQWYCWYLLVMGRHDESLIEGRRALELDQMAPAINLALGKASLSSGLIDDSMRQCKRTLEFDQNFIPGHYFLGQAYEQKGMYEQAVEEYRIAFELTGGYPLGRAILSKAEALAGKKDEAESTLRSLLELSITDQIYVPAYSIALLYLGLSDPDRAIEWLNRAFDERFIWLVYLKVDPVFDSLRSEVGFQRLAERMGFPRAAGRQARAAFADD